MCDMFHGTAQQQTESKRKKHNRRVKADGETHKHPCSSNKPPKWSLSQKGNFKCPHGSTDKPLHQNFHLLYVSISPNVNSPPPPVPKAVLAGVASFLIQKDTQERTTVRMQGMYVWMVK